MIDLNKFAIDKAKEFDCNLSIINFIAEIRMVRLVEDKISLKDIIVNYSLKINDYIIESYQYRNLSANIIMISSIFDQQLYNFYNLLYGNPKKNNYDDLKKYFTNKNTFVSTDFSKIDVYHTIANALKHGQSSKAYKTLINDNSVYVQPNKDFPNLLKNNSFNLPILNISKSTLKDFCLAIEDFWNSLNIKAI